MERHGEITPSAWEMCGAMSAGMGWERCVCPSSKMGGEPNLLYFKEVVYCRQDKEKEIAMITSVIVLLLFLVRLVVPIILILLVGEWFSRHESSSWLKV